MTYLEETYYHRLNPAEGFGLQRVFTEDGSLDETMAVADGNVVLVCWLSPHWFAFARSTA